MSGSDVVLSNRGSGQTGSRNRTGWGEGEEGRGKEGAGGIEGRGGGNEGERKS